MGSVPVVSRVVRAEGWDHDRVFSRSVAGLCYRTVHGRDEGGGHVL